MCSWCISLAPCPLAVIWCVVSTKYAGKGAHCKQAPALGQCCRWPGACCSSRFACLLDDLHTIP